MAKNQLSNLNELYQALENAPQDKEGAFRVATWKMVIGELIKLKEQLDTAEVNGTSVIESVKQIREEIKKEKDKINDQDADVILF